MIQTGSQNFEHAEQNQKISKVMKRKCFDSVAEADYLPCIQDFKNCYLEIRKLTKEKSLQLTVTPSVHVVLMLRTLELWRA